MYIESGIEKLSNAQVSKLLNGHRVRIKKGQGAKLHMTEEHCKKLNRAHMKGAGTTIQLDPYAIASNQHLRQAVAAVLKRMMGGTALIDQPFTARQAVNATGNFFKDPGGTIGFGSHGGTLLIDQPFTVRQAVNSTGNFFKDPGGTIGFGFEGPLPSPDRDRVPVIPNAYKGRGGPPKQMNGQGFWEDVGKVAKKAGKTAVKALANEVVQYAGPTAGAAFAAAATAAGQPQYAPAAAVFGNEFGTRAGNYANKRIQGMGVKKRRGRPRKGGAALPPGTPYGVY